MKPIYKNWLEKLISIVLKITILIILLIITSGQVIVPYLRQQNYEYFLIKYNIIFFIKIPFWGQIYRLKL